MVMRALSLTDRGAPRSVARDEYQDADAATLFRIHAPFVARFLFRLGVSAEDLDDVVQEVFLVAHRRGGYARGPASRMTYLANITMSAAWSWRRRDRTQRARWAELPDAQASGAPGPVEWIEEREAMRHAQRALDALEPGLRSVLILVELEGASCASVAAGLGAPIGTIYWRLHQARKRFMKAVDAVSAAEPTIREPPGRRTRSMAIRSIFWWKSRRANDLLDVARNEPPVRYDSQMSLARHHALVRQGAPLPSWIDARVLGTAKTAAGLTTTVWWAAGSAVLVGAGAVGWSAMHDAPFARAAWQPTPVAARAVVGHEPAASVPLVAIPPPASLLAIPSASSTPTPLPGRETTSSLAPDDHASTSERLAGAATKHVSPRASARMPSAAFASTGDGTGVATRSDALTAAAPASSAASPTPAAQTTRGPPSDGDELREMGDVAAAGRALATDPARALALVQASEARVPAGYMGEERSYIAIMALFALGRRAEGRAGAERFLRAYPSGTFSDRIRSAMQAAH
jgi:RNA polymerase sigma-70 factor, ECF subfamily